MEPAVALARLRSALKVAITGSPLSARELSRRLGRHPEYLTRALNGHLEIKFRETAEVLAQLGTAADDFFDAVFPLGDGGPPPAWRRAGASSSRSDGVTRWVLERPARQGPPPTPPEVTAKAAAVLRGMIRRRGLTQRGISRGLGLSEDALGQALRGFTQLSFRHVFGILGELDTEPGRFFAEVSGPAPPDVAGHLRWLRYLDAAEQRLAEAAREAAERGRADQESGSRRK